VLDLTGWSERTLYRKIAENQFPRGEKLDPSGRTLVWYDEVIEAWQNGEWKPAPETEAA
jgi:predicted DNA-binding transcriptional regulator AlpA